MKDLHAPRPTSSPPVVVATLRTIAPIPVAAARPDGPLVADLAAWVDAAELGDNYGPIPLLAPAPLLAPVDVAATVAGDDDGAGFAAWVAGLTGRPIYLLATGNHHSPYVALLGVTLPGAP